jgi:hypothetical protein
VYTITGGKLWPHSWLSVSNKEKPEASGSDRSSTMQSNVCARRYSRHWPAGMAVTFAGVATLAVVSGDWAVHTNQYGRIAAIVLLAMFGITLLFPAVADRVTRPLVTAGAWLSERAHSNGHSGSPVFPLRERLSEELPDVRFSFEPNDIVSQVMSFGAPTPIDGRAARRH